MTIQIIKNFIAKQEADPIVYFINEYLTRFTYNAERGRWVLRFGYDDEFPGQSLSEISMAQEIRNQLLDIFNKTAKVFEEEVFLTSWFLSKQHSGGKLRPHKDSLAGQFNDQLEYTAMLYLNTLDDNGDIVFPDAGFAITPELGDLVIFKSKEDAHFVSEIMEDRYALPMWFTKDKAFEFVP